MKPSIRRDLKQRLHLAVSKFSKIAFVIDCREMFYAVLTHIQQTSFQRDRWFALITCFGVGLQAGNTPVSRMYRAGLVLIRVWTMMPQTSQEHSLISQRHWKIWRMAKKIPPKITVVPKITRSVPKQFILRYLLCLHYFAWNHASYYFPQVLTLTVLGPSRIASVFLHTDISSRFESSWSYIWDSFVFVHWFVHNPGLLNLRINWALYLN